MCARKFSPRNLFHCLDKPVILKDADRRNCRGDRRWERARAYCATSATAPATRRLAEERPGGGWPRGTGGASLVEETRARRGDRTKSLRPPPFRPLPSPATASATAPSSPSASLPQRPCRAPYLYILPGALQFLPEVEQTLVSLFIALATLDSVTRPTPNAMLYNSERPSIPYSLLSRCPIRLPRQPPNFG